MIFKFLGLSQLVYPESTLDVPKEIMSILKAKLFSYLWTNRKVKIIGGGGGGIKTSLKVDRVQ